MVRGIVFDMDQTLYDRDASDAVVMAGYFRSHRGAFLDGCTEAEAVRAMQHADTHGGHFGWERILSLLYGTGVLKGPVDFEEFCEYFQYGYGTVGVPYPWTLPTLHALHAMGLSTAIITNGFEERQWRKLRHFGLPEACDAVMIGGKPGKEVFLAMADRLHARPDELWYVGDHPLNDVQGSRGAGYVPVWIRTMPWDYPEVEKPALQIDRVDELVGMVEKEIG